MTYKMKLLFFTRRYRMIKITGPISLLQAEKRVMDSLTSVEKADLKLSEIESI